MNRIVALLAGLAVVAACAPAQADGAERRRKSACQKLEAKHRDLSRHRKLVLVRRGDYDLGDISACVLPRGKVRRLARWDDGLGRAQAGIAGTKGVFVLVWESWNDQYGGTSEGLWRVDARTGRRVGLAGYGCMLDHGRSSCPDGTSYGEVALAATGAGAVELTDLATGATTLQAFDPAGTLARLDEGPVDDLRIAGREIVWLREGVERRAPLPS